MSSPQVIFAACIDTIVAAGRLKVLPGKIMLENGQLCTVSYKNKLLPKQFKECHTKV